MHSVGLVTLIDWLNLIFIGPECVFGTLFEQVCGGMTFSCPKYLQIENKNL